jgi:chemotaxis protein CheX
MQYIIYVNLLRQVRFMDIRNINSFTEVIMTTFKTSVNSTPYRCGDFERIEGDIRNEEDLMTMITFSGTLTGAILMTFPAETAKKVYASLMFEEVEEINNEVVEAFTEIMNMVVGNVKAVLADHKLSFDDPMATAKPKVKFENTDKVSWLYIPMKFKDWGSFRLYLGVLES